jgi:hypothetical protein
MTADEPRYLDPAAQDDLLSPDDDEGTEEEELRLREREVDPKLSDEEGFLAPERRIGHSVHCGVCGYRLQYLPYIGQCPECGGEYDARALSMRGIFLSSAPEFPLGHLFATVVMAATAGALIGRFLNPFQSGPIFLGLLMGAGAVYTAVHALKILGTIIRHAKVAASVARQERWQDDDD